MSIKVLIVDDSLLFRKILEKGLNVDAQLDVVASATDPFDAVEKIEKHKPDVVICDIEMPKMDGIEFVKRLLPQYPVPVVVVSSADHRVFDAMNSGAVDFVPKPNVSSPESVQEFILLLIQKTKMASQATIDIKSKRVKKATASASHKYDHELIAVGASTGGTKAITDFLLQLPQNIPPIVIVQHIPPTFSTMFAERLNTQTHFTVKEASGGDILKNNHVYIAPGDRHMAVVKMDGKYAINISRGAKVSGHRPSADVLFDSVAHYAKGKAIGVILTGMGSDGAKGLTNMRRVGAATLGQDEKSSVVYGMPKEAYEMGGVTKQCSLDLMGHYLMKFLK